MKLIETTENMKSTYRKYDQNRDSFTKRSFDEIYESTATHSSTLAWEVPWTEEPGRLQSMGSLQVGHD